MARHTPSSRLDLAGAVEARATRRTTRIRSAVVFVLVWLVLAGLAGERLWTPSPNNHYVHLAQAWLHGRLDHGGVPPGYCTAAARRSGHCRQHAYDDWAVVTTLGLRDGRTLVGFPCRTSACGVTRRNEHVETWWILGDGWFRIPTLEISSRSERWYVTFPPGPALLFLPFVALFGTRVLDGLIVVTLAAATVALWVTFLDRWRGLADGRAHEHLVWACAWGLGSAACGLAAHGEVWFTAQLTGGLALVAFLRSAWRGSPSSAGAWIGLAMASRPTLALAAVLYPFLPGASNRSRAALLRFGSVFALCGLVLATLNVVRFADPLEFGHRYLDIRWQSRIQTWGMFSVHYFSRNLQAMATLLPRWQSAFPFIEVSIHGMALWISTPWLLWLPFAKARFRGATIMAGCLVVLAVTPLFYQNSGQVQFSYRFALDWLPLAIVLMAGSDLGRRVGLRVAVVVACLIHGWGAYAWTHAPGRLFVTDPPGWPFEAELEESF